MARKKRGGESERGGDGGGGDGGKRDGGIEASRHHIKQEEVFQIFLLHSLLFPKK